MRAQATAPNTPPISSLAPFQPVQSNVFPQENFFSEVYRSVKHNTEIAESISHTIVSQKDFYKIKQNFHTLKQRLSEILVSIEKSEVELNISRRELLLDYDFRILLINMSKSIFRMIEGIRKTKRNFRPFVGSTKTNELCLLIQQKMDGIRANFNIKVYLEGSAKPTGETAATIEFAKDNLAKVSA